MVFLACYLIFKSSTCQSAASEHLISCNHLSAKVCMYVCVCVCEAINNKWRDLDFIRLVELLQLLFSYILWLLPSMSSIGMTPVTKCIMSYSQRRLREGCISHLYCSKRHFTPPSLLTRRNASVLKVGVLYVWKMMKCVASYSLRRLR